MGRPTVITLEKITELKQAFAIGCTDKEACAYAKVSEASFYRYIEDNPEFREETNELKLEPILKAKTTIVKELSDVRNAQWYLERKSKDEFSIRSELSGPDGAPLSLEVKDSTE